MNQDWLNQLVVLHIHKQIADDLNSKDMLLIMFFRFRVTAQLVAIEVYINK